MRDFHQEVTFKQYFYLHQFMFLCANCLIVYLSGFFFFFWGGGVGWGGGGGGGWGGGCVCLDYSKTNEQLFI